MSAPASAPISNLEGSRTVPYYGWRTRTAECRCGWSGPATALVKELFVGGMALDCPRCLANLATTLWPDEPTTRAAAAAGDPEAARELAKYDQ